MDKAITLTIQVIARAGSRSVSYNVKDMERALRDVGLEPVRESFIFTATQTWPSTKTAIAARTAIEKAIQRVHRKAVYRFSFS